MMREYAPLYPLGLLDYAKSLRDYADLKETEAERNELLKNAEEAEKLYENMSKEYVC